MRMFMKALCGRVRIIGLVLLALAAPSIAADAPKPPAAVSYTLTAEQAVAIKRAIMLGDFWLNVRTQAAGQNTVEARGFELQRIELGQLFQELAKQDAAAAAAALAPPKPAEEVKP